jgi:hypothetical protein
MVKRWGGEGVGDSVPVPSPPALLWPGLKPLVRSALALAKNDKLAPATGEPRARRLENPRIHDGSGHELVWPDPTLMRQIYKESGGKVWAFRPPNFTSGVTDIPQRIVRPEEYQRTIAEPLFRQIYLTFPGRSLALVSTPVSINGNRPAVSLFSDIRGVPDVVEVLRRDGAEANDIKNSPEVIRMNPYGSVTESSVHSKISPVTAIAQEIAARSASLRARDGDLAVFPAVLIYDEGLPTAGDRPAWQDGSSPDDVLGIYIAGYPSV